MNDDDPTEDDDLDDPVMWGGAELGKPAARQSSPPPARRKGVEAGAGRRELARRAGEAVQRFGPRPPWPGASKPIPDVLELNHPPAGALTPDDDLDGEP